MKIDHYINNNNENFRLSELDNMLFLKKEENKTDKKRVFYYFLYLDRKKFNDQNKEKLIKEINKYMEIKKINVKEFINFIIDMKPSKIGENIVCGLIIN